MLRKVHTSKRKGGDSHVYKCAHFNWLYLSIPNQLWRVLSQYLDAGCTTIILLCYGIKISNQYSHLKTTDWSHVFNITTFPCNCILFTKFNTKLLHKHSIITIFHYQLILWHVQPHLLAKKSGRNMSENRLIMKKCFCSKLVLNFCKSHVM
jgi:hypothetical protein